MNRDRFPISEKEVRNRVSTGKRLSVINPATGKQLVAVPYVDRALLNNKAISDARNAFSGWGAVPFGRRKAILASLLNKIDVHADELSALLTAEQGGHLAQARREIDLLTKAFGPALMQMDKAHHEALCPDPRRQCCRPMEFVSSTFILGRYSPRYWLVIQSF